MLADSDPFYSNLTLGGGKSAMDRVKAEMAQVKCGTIRWPQGSCVNGGCVSPESVRLGTRTDRNETILFE